MNETRLPNEAKRSPGNGQLHTQSPASKHGTQRPANEADSPNEPRLQMVRRTNHRATPSRSTHKPLPIQSLRLIWRTRTRPITAAETKPAGTQQFGQADHPTAPRRAPSVPPSLHSSGANPYLCSHFRKPHAESPDQLNQLERRLIRVTGRSPTNASQHTQVD